jgi:molybdate transport system substrate-binding protein
MNVIARILSVLLIAAVTMSAPAASRTEAQITVFAAASLTETLQKISAAYTAESGVPVRLSFAASSALARQIETGARVDVFCSADEEWTDYLQGRDLIDASTRVSLLANRLVLIASSKSEVSVELVPGVSLSPLLGANGRLALADPDAVPAGRYGKAALVALGTWQQLERRLARAENVRVALMYVARREAPLGVVYATDARLDRRVRVVAVFPETSHPRLTYSVALTANARPGAREYLQYLQSETARGIFEAAGFIVLPAP